MKWWAERKMEVKTQEGVGGGGGGGGSWCGNFKVRSQNESGAPTPPSLVPSS